MASAGGAGAGAEASWRARPKVEKRCVCAGLARRLCACACACACACVGEGEGVRVGVRVRAVVLSSAGHRKAGIEACSASWSSSVRAWRRAGRILWEREREREQRKVCLLHYQYCCSMLAGSGSVPSVLFVQTVARVLENYLGRRTCGKDARTAGARGLQPIAAGHERGGQAQRKGAGSSSDALTGGTSFVSAKLRVPQTLRPPSESPFVVISSQLRIERRLHRSSPPVALSCCTVVFAANMLSSTSRTALRRAANNKFTVKAGVRAASAWSNVAQGPPVSQLLVLPSWLGPANVLAGCKCSLKHAGRCSMNEAYHWRPGHSGHHRGLQGRQQPQEDQLG
jgi:hypothetical protein